MSAKKKQSVLVLTPWFPDRPGDREGSYIHASALALAAHGLSVSVLVTRPWVPAYLRWMRPAWLVDDFDAGAFQGFDEVRLVHHLSVPRGFLPGVTAWSHRHRVSPLLREMVRSRKVDIIHAQTEGEAALAVEIAREFDIPAVVSLHGVNTSPRWLGHPRRRQEFGEALGRASRVILVGEPLRPPFRDIAGGDGNFCVVPNGVDVPEQFAARARPILQDGVVHFISVSNLHEGKGIDIALRALAILRDKGLDRWRYTVVGDGMEQPSLQQMADALGLSEHVRFAGAQPHDRIHGLLSTADVFVLPSYREAFGIAYLEAMVAGLVTIGVRGQGSSAFIAHGETGFLVEPRDPRAVADCIGEIIANPARAREVAAAGADIARTNFTWGAHARRLREIYDQAGSA